MTDQDRFDLPAEQAIQTIYETFKNSLDTKYCALNDEYGIRKCPANFENRLCCIDGRELKIEKLYDRFARRICIG